MWVAVADLKPWVKNPRRNDDAVKRIAESIKRFGFGAPLVARKANGEVIAGHTRLKAAMSLGLERVPVRYLDITAKQAHQLAIGDNRLGELADWDDGLLREIMAGFTREDNEVLGFSGAEIDRMISALAPPTAADPQLRDGLIFSVVVTCRDEQQQAAMLVRPEGEGLTCRPLIS